MRTTALKKIYSLSVVLFFAGYILYSQEINQEYLIESALGTFLDVKEANASPKATVWTWYNNNGTGQKWEFEDAGNGYFYIKSALGNYLDIKGANPDTRAQVWMWSKNRSPGQKWKFEDAGQGYFYIKSALGKYLDIKGANSDTRAAIWMWSKNGGAGQKWKLIPIEIPKNKGYEIVLHFKTGQDDLRKTGRVDVIAQWLDGGKSVRQERFKNINNSKGWEAWSTKKVSVYASMRASKIPDLIYIAADLSGADNVLLRNSDTWDFNELKIEVFSLHPKKKRVFSNIYTGKEGIASIYSTNSKGVKFSNPILFRLFGRFNYGPDNERENRFDKNY